MNLKQIRLSKNMTQKQLADEIGIDHTIISKYEKGQLIPSKDRMELLAKALGVNIDMLINNEALENVPIPMRRRATFTTLDDDRLIVSESLLAKQLILYKKGVCELCGQMAPFQASDGTPFLEYHHLKWLSEGGTPTLDNMVVLCPNCHRKIHELNDAEDIKKLQEAAKTHNSIEILGVSL